MSQMTLYIARDTLFHRMDGAAKMLLLAAWTVIVFLFQDIRIFIGLFVVGLLLLSSARLPVRRVRFLIWLMIGFNVFNSLLNMWITPTYGSEIAGSTTVLLHLGYNVLTLETVFYVLTLSMKYMSLMPITVLFIFTTHPTRFASSLNRIGVPYKIAYAFNIAFRYLPELQAEFRHILHALQARGVGFGKGEGTISQRLKHVAWIAIPLVQSSLQRIEQVSNAMDLRGFGKHPLRSWYSATVWRSIDSAVAAISLIMLLIAIYIRIQGFGTFWYPF
ncbi:energy-coupling factor transporter transmembrane component T family protein [Paenibacillus sp. 481]|uniref:energy-coupling factor transporter transmembrane component T family protein n=1 Tax=Paenibacillus sp. 481 TaxID=2835869 RepID=UPI001E371989|nr:energy-coupling factor transporter transmembrane component T [Paenibacillus sp. 481]UHA75633.1 energy-coupling factor transporter transmembrane protein EcfT [Paenibacillus sp. 481]